MDKMPEWTQKNDDSPQQNKYIFFFYKNKEVNRYRNGSAGCRLARPLEWKQAGNATQNLSRSQKAKGANELAKGANGFAGGKRSFWCSTILQALTVRVGWERFFIKFLWFLAVHQSTREMQRSHPQEVTWGSPTALLPGEAKSQVLPEPLTPRFWLWVLDCTAWPKDGH